MEQVNVRLPGRRAQYEIRIAAGLLKNVGMQARTVSEAARRIVVVSNPKVFKLFGEGVVHSLRAANFEVSTWLMRDGESHKSLRSLEAALSFLAKSGLERNDLVVA